jgi:Ser/Thr protein kinase RdoA (MazF antagonist)
MSMTRPEVLAKYRRTADDLVGQGMESAVYTYGLDSVLKIYDQTTSRAHLRLLQDFYDSLDRTAVSFALPSIRSVAVEGPYLVTIEKRLPGSPMADILPTLAPNQLDRWFESYVETVLELGRIPMADSTIHYKLFDPHQLSRRVDGDWHHFLQRYLALQLTSLSDYFARDVTAFHEKRKRMEMVLSPPYTGPYNLVHGDIFPGNILVSSTGRTEVLLDFGLFTMYGDPYFDLATSWVFFDMYDQLQANVRERLLTLLIARLGEQARPRLYRYVLLYSLLSANTYASDCTDGHYEWCVANLNTEDYWNDMN